MVMEACHAMCECHWNPMPGGCHTRSGEMLYWPWVTPQSFQGWAGAASREVDTRLGCPHH